MDEAELVAFGVGHDDPRRADLLDVVAQATGAELAVVRDGMPEPSSAVSGERA